MGESPWGFESLRPHFPAGNLWRMCMQCMGAAMGVGATATGTRSYIAAKHFSWVTPRRMKAITAALLASSLLSSAFLVSGSTRADPGPPRPSPGAAHRASSIAPAPTRAASRG